MPGKSKHRVYCCYDGRKQDEIYPSDRGRRWTRATYLEISFTGHPPLRATRANATVLLTGPLAGRPAYANDRSFHSSSRPRIRRRNGSNFSHTSYSNTALSKRSKKRDRQSAAEWREKTHTRTVTARHEASLSTRRPPPTDGATEKEAASRRSCGGGGVRGAGAPGVLRDRFNCRRCLAVQEEAAGSTAAARLGRKGWEEQGRQEREGGLRLTRASRGRDAARDVYRVCFLNTPEICTLCRNHERVGLALHRL